MARADKAGRKARQAEKDWMTGDARAEPAVDPAKAEPQAPSFLEPEPPRSRFRWLRTLFLWLLAIGLLTAVAVPTWFWFDYRALHVTSTNAAVRGYVSDVGTRLSGAVTSVEVDVGDRVQQGQVLVRLADRHLQAEVLEARAELEGLKRTLDVERLTIAHQRREVAQQASEADARAAAAEAQTTAAQIRLDNASQEHQSRKTLFERDGAVSSEDVRVAETNRRTAAAQLEEARANSDVARSAGRKARLDRDALAIREQNLGVLEANVRRAEARLARAEADLESTLVRAPEAGAIVRRNVQPGASVELGQPVISMWLGDQVWIEAWIDEDDIGQVRSGAEATVTLHSFPGREFSGVVDKIGLATDLEIPDSDVPQPRFSRMRGAPVVGVRIRLNEPAPEFLPGLSAVVAIRKAG